VSSIAPHRTLVEQPDGLALYEHTTHAVLLDVCALCLDACILALDPNPAPLGAARSRAAIKVDSRVACGLYIVVLAVCNRAPVELHPGLSPYIHTTRLTISLN
jgi:hypothetical protein